MINDERLPIININIEQNNVENIKRENIRLKQQNKDLRKRVNELLEEIVVLKYKKRNYNVKDEDTKIKQKEYEVFRKSILKRDNYTCQECGSRYRLQVHHIKSKKKYPELIMDPDNCITLCIVCHSKTDSFFVT